MNQRDEHNDISGNLFRMMTEAESAKFELERRFMDGVVFGGLANLNVGFDSPGVAHFSADDFITVIDRCVRVGIEISGIEVCSTAVKDPQWKADLLDIQISPEPGYEWARRVVEKWKDQPEVTFCATFSVPDLLLEGNWDAVRAQARRTAARDDEHSDLCE